MVDSRDAGYRELILAPIRLCAHYLPKMGGGVDVNFTKFAEIYGDDPFYHWIGLDSAPMYSAHKAAGGMTSLYRQLGIGAERLFRQVIRDQLDLDNEQVRWSYQEMVPNARAGKSRIKTLTLDGRIEVSDIKDSKRRELVREWIESQAAKLDISIPLSGVVFEVRQGYKSADSKRQNADISNASQALAHGYLPALAIMSTQINETVYERYMLNNWVVLTGTISPNSAESTFAFIDEVLGYDLVSFFERNSTDIRSEVLGILDSLLKAS